MYHAYKQTSDFLASAPNARDGQMTRLFNLTQSPSFCRINWRMAQVAFQPICASLFVALVPRITNFNGKAGLTHCCCNVCG